MPIVRNKAKELLFALCLCFTSFCHAIGFGDLKVYSYLNEPLVAEITLTGFKGMDPGLLKASLADAKDFVRAGIDRPYFLTYLVFEVLSYEDQLLIVVRTSKSVQVPYLEFLVELSWPEGNLIKDYTVLLDPPPPNLSKEMRPKSISQIAEQSRGKSFGPDAIQAQLDKQKAEQQRAAAAEDLSGIVKLTPSSFSDNTFDSDLPKKDTPLVPSEVPDIEETEQAVQAAKAAQQAAQAATEVAYQKQLAAFKQEEQQKPTTILSKVVDKLEELEEPIDFQHVLPPTPHVAAVAPEPVANAQPEPAVVLPVALPVFQPPTDSKTVPATSNHLYLGIILSLLLIAAGVAVAVKRMHDARARQPQPQEPETLVPEELEEFSMHDESIHEVLPEEPEEIELTSPIDNVLPSNDEGGQNKFDREFDKIDLSELATPVLEEDSITIEPPTLVKTSGLTLEPEGATLINPLTTTVLDNSDAVQVKLDLAKKYLDTGDKESAKELLQEIIEIANDSQRLEAQMLLTSIV